MNSAWPVFFQVSQVLVYLKEIKHIEKTMASKNIQSSGGITHNHRIQVTVKCHHSN